MNYRFIDILVGIAIMAGGIMTLYKLKQVVSKTIKYRVRFLKFFGLQSDIGLNPLFNKIVYLIACAFFIFIGFLLIIGKTSFSQ